MNRFYLLLLCPLLLFSCKKDEGPDTPVGTGNSTFLVSDANYDSIYVRKDYREFKGMDLLSGHLTYVSDDEAAIILKTGSYDPTTAGALRLEHVTATSQLKLGKNFTEPDIVRMGQATGFYHYFPPDSQVYYAGYTTQGEKGLAFQGTNSIVSTGDAGHAFIGPRKQLAIIGPAVTTIIENGVFSESYPTRQHGAFFFDQTTDAFTHRAYWIYFDRANKTIKVDSMDPGIPVIVPGTPKTPATVLNEPAGMADSVVYYFLNAQQFGDKYIISLNWTNKFGDRRMNIYRYDRTAVTPVPILETLIADVPMEDYVNPYYYTIPDNLAFHFNEDGGMYIARKKAAGGGMDIFRRIGVTFEEFNPLLSSGGFIQSAKTSNKRLYLTIGNGTSRVEIIRTKAQ